MRKILPLLALTILIVPGCAPTEPLAGQPVAGPATQPGTAPARPAEAGTVRPGPLNTQPEPGGPSAATQPGARPAEAAGAAGAAKPAEVQPGNAAQFDIYIESWTRIAFGPSWIAQGDALTWHSRKEAEAAIARHRGPRTGRTEVMLAKNLDINPRGFAAEIDEIQNWLTAQGVTDIQFRLATSDDVLPTIRERPTSQPPGAAGPVSQPAEVDVASGSVPAPASGRPPATQGDIRRSIAALASDDGPTRVAATNMLFALGRNALAPLAQAGARQVTPSGPAASRRIDMVYSLLAGLQPNPVSPARGYRIDSFTLVVEKGCTMADVKKIGERHGFTVPWKFDRAAHAILAPSRNLADVVHAVLSAEPQVITVNLDYFEATP